MNDLIKIQAITFEKDSVDTRLKHVHLSEKGEKIFEEIFSIQKRIYKALLNSSSAEVIHFKNILNKIINE